STPGRITNGRPSILSSAGRRMRRARRGRNARNQARLARRAALPTRTPPDGSSIGEARSKGTPCRTFAVYLLIVWVVFRDRGLRCLRGRRRTAGGAAGRGPPAW